MRKDFTRFIFTYLVITFFLIACGLSGLLNGGFEDAEGELGGVVWMLKVFGEQGNSKPAVDDSGVTLQFDFNQKTVKGNGGCNSYSASFEIDGSGLSISPAMSTLMACFPEEIMNQETAFHQVLAKVNSYEVKEGMLFLYTSNNQVLEFSTK